MLVVPETALHSATTFNAFAVSGGGEAPGPLERAQKEVPRPWDREISAQLCGIEPLGHAMVKAMRKGNVGP
jgi:hypothetical protein